MRFQVHFLGTPGIVTTSWKSEQLMMSFSPISLQLMLETFGTKGLSGAKMFLLYISAQMSNPPSIHKFLHIRQYGTTDQTFQSLPYSP